MTRTPAKLPFTAAQLVAAAAGEEGYVEQPTNRTKYGKALGLDGVMWCGIFIWWVFVHLGWDLRRHGIPNPESTNAFDAQMRAAGWQLIRANNVRPGDVLLYDFGVTAPGDPANDDDHVGIAATRVRKGQVEAWEGNTSPTQRGSQRNGGGVYLKTRSTSLIRHAYRPPFSTATELRRAARKARTVTVVGARRATEKTPAKGKPATRRAATHAAAAILAGAAASTGTVLVTAPPSPRPCTSQAPTSPTPGAPRAARPTYTRSLAVQTKPLTGSDVSAVQVEVGVRPDRTYGPTTGIAVRAWKKALGLPATTRWTKASARAAGWTIR